MDKKQIIFKHIILLFLSGGIIFLLNDYFKQVSSHHHHLSRDYIVVKAFGAINYHEPLTFPPGQKTLTIISAFDLQRGADLNLIFHRKNNQTSSKKNQNWQHININYKIYEDSDLKITFAKDI